MKGLRKHTRMEFCERHGGWFAGETRRRQAECMVEGGPGSMSPGCEGGRCRLWPGTDFFEPSVCTGEMALDWTVAPHMTARLGGALTLDADDFGKDGKATREEFAKWYGKIGYVYIDLPSGETLSVFYNDETRLFVADIVNAEETGGNEFVRCTVPDAPTFDREEATMDVDPAGAL